MQALLLFPNQLFRSIPFFKRPMKVFLIEEFLFFRQYPFHRQKLLFHRASMQAYAKHLAQEGIGVKVVESHKKEADIRVFLRQLSAKTIHIFDPVDDYLEKRIRKGCIQRGIRLVIHENPSFLNSRADTSSFFHSSQKRWLQNDFYIWQRKRLKVLVDSNHRPIGGKWSFDTENRKRYPAKKRPPELQFPSSNDTYREALDYVRRHFPQNPGDLSDTPLYPFDFASAQTWLGQFLTQRFAEFGLYQDALVTQSSSLHHSLLSPLLNTGLLTPNEVLKQIIDYAEQNHILLNNTEGLVRQILGWREFVRGVYVTQGGKQRSSNFWGWSRPIPRSFYEANTGIVPIDTTIKKLLRTGYCHHIERLMVLGNFMLLCEFNPHEVYQWFMELFIDAYDWVMVPNVYGMSQFSDGGTMTTKPYISGSNYLRKMSDYPQGEWQATWDGLFWNFLSGHREFFRSNHRLRMLVKMWDNMDSLKKQEHIHQAQTYLENLEQTTAQD